MKYTQLFNDTLHFLNRRYLQHRRVRLAATVEKDNTITALRVLRGVVPNTGWIPSHEPVMRFDAQKPDDVTLWHVDHPNIFFREQYARTVLPAARRYEQQARRRLQKLKKDLAEYPLDGKWSQVQPIPSKEDTSPRPNPWEPVPEGHYRQHEIKDQTFKYVDVAPKDLDERGTCTLFMGSFYVNQGSQPATCFGQIRLGNPKYPNLGLECKDGITWIVYKVGQVRPVRPDQPIQDAKSDAEVLCKFTLDDSLANPIAHTTSDNLSDTLKHNEWFRIMHQLGVKHPELPTLARLLMIDEMVHGVNAHQVCDAHNDRFKAWSECEGTDAEKLEAFLNCHPYKLPEGDPS